jgi:hypothetical protein
MNAYATLDTVNSPNFNVLGWGRAKRALDKANAPKVEVINVTSAVERLKSAREADTKTAEMLGLSKQTVKVLRAACKARGLTGYGKAKKAHLLALLA